MFYYCDPDGHTEYVYSKEKLPVDDRTPYLGKFVFKDIECKDVNIAAGAFYGLPEAPIDSIDIVNVSFTYSDNPKEVKEYLDLYDAMEKTKTAMENAGQATYDARTEVNNIKTSIDTLESTLDTFDASDFSKELKQETADSKNIFKK